MVKNLSGENDSAEQHERLAELALTRSLSKVQSAVVSMQHGR